MHLFLYLFCFQNPDCPSEPLWVIGKEKVQAMGTARAKTLSEECEWCGRQMVRAERGRGDQGLRSERCQVQSGEPWWLWVGLGFHAAYGRDLLEDFEQRITWSHIFLKDDLKWKKRSVKRILQWSRREKMAVKPERWLWRWWELFISRHIWG